MKKLMTLAAVAACVIITGCANQAQPQRSQTQTVELRGDNSALTVDQSKGRFAPSFDFAAFPREGYEPNAYEQVKGLLSAQAQAFASAACASSGDKHGDALSQNMMIETGGNEENSATATSTPTTTVPVDVSWGGATGAGATTAASAAGTLVEKGVQWYSNRSASTNAVTSAPAAPAAPAATNCVNGKCEEPQ